MFKLNNNLVHEIEELVEMYDLSFIDAIVYYSDKHGIEIESIAEILKKNEAIKFQIELEAEGLHFLKKQNRLPI